LNRLEERQFRTDRGGLLLRQLVALRLGMYPVLDLTAIKLWDFSF
jgi:hypothetical protein